jgi:hypothetical protein
VSGSDKIGERLTVPLKEVVNSYQPILQDLEIGGQLIAQMLVSPTPSLVFHFQAERTATLRSRDIAARNQSLAILLFNLRRNFALAGMTLFSQ